MISLHPTRMTARSSNPKAANPRRRRGRGRGRARRNNPSPAVRTGIGAALGSLAGAVIGVVAGMVTAVDSMVTDYEEGFYDPAFDTTTGSARKVMMMPLIVMGGSAIGGAIGGGVAAPEGRKAMGALGGGLGGLVGPIGAGLGGALAGGMGKEMRDNPSAAGWAGIIALGAVAVGGGYLAYKELMPAKALPPGGGTGLRYQVYEAGDGTWTFAIYDGASLVYIEETTPFANQQAATIAAQNWIAANGTVPTGPSDPEAYDVTTTAVNMNGQEKWYAAVTYLDPSTGQLSTVHEAGPFITEQGAIDAANAWIAVQA